MLHHHYQHASILEWLSAVSTRIFSMVGLVLGTIYQIIHCWRSASVWSLVFNNTFNS